MSDGTRTKSSQLQEAIFVEIKIVLSLTLVYYVYKVFLNLMQNIDFRIQYSSLQMF